MESRQLVDRHVEFVPGRGAAGARLRDSGVDLWALITYYKYAVDCDIAAVARDYDVPTEAVEAALIYYNQNKETLDARIAANLDHVA